MKGKVFRIAWRALAIALVTLFVCSTALASSSSERKLSSRVKVYASTSTSIYKSATSSSKKLGTVPKGTKMYAVAINGRYTRVKSASGSHYGYALTSNLSKSRPSGKSGSSSSSGSSTRMSLRVPRPVSCPFSSISPVDMNPPS